MVIDAFPFFNELDLLEVRLNILDSVVDYFVIVEAAKTQTLQDKPFYYELNKERFKKFEDKILHVKLEADICPKNDNRWEMENFQRNAIRNALFHMDSATPIPDDTIILISDCDEIPNPEAVKAVVNIKDDAHVISFGMQFHSYFADLYSPDKGWIGTVATRWETLRHIDPQVLRDVKDRAPIILDDAGWHLSWLGGYTKVYEKFVSCVEPFDKDTVPDLEEVKKIFANRVLKDGQFHLIDKDDSVNLEACPDDKLPEYLAKEKIRYPNFFSKTASFN